MNLVKRQKVGLTSNLYMYISERFEISLVKVDASVGDLGLTWLDIVDLIPPKQLVFPVVSSRHKQIDYVAARSTVDVFEWSLEPVTACHLILTNNEVSALPANSSACYHLCHHHSRRPANMDRFQNTG